MRVIVDTAVFRRRLETLVRYGALGVNYLATRGLGALARQARKLEIRIDGIGSFAAAPLIDIPIPHVDLAAHDDPISLIVHDPRYRDTVDSFARHASPARSLLPIEAQALLYILVRHMRPDHVAEIGVFKAATTEAIARALHANGRGVVHAVDPYRSEYIAAIFAQWPAALAGHVSFHPRNSVQFFDEMKQSGIRLSLALVDGNHDYEFAAFDIESAARLLTPGGFIAVDNVTLPGPFFAVRDFLERNPGWIECGGSTAGYDRSKAHDKNRTRISNTDLIILRAPHQRTLSGRPWSPGQIRTSRNRVDGVRVAVATMSRAGTLHVQIILRGFGAQPAVADANASVRLDGAQKIVEVPLAGPLHLAGAFTHFTIEPCLIWQGEQPLRISGEPEIF